MSTRANSCGPWEVSAPPPSSRSVGTPTFSVTLEGYVSGQHRAPTAGPCAPLPGSGVFSGRKPNLCRPQPSGQDDGQGWARAGAGPALSRPSLAGPLPAALVLRRKDLSAQLGTHVSSSFFTSLERNFSLKLVRVTSPGYFRSSKFSSNTSWSSASEEAKEWAAGSDCKRPAGRCFNRWRAGRPAQG